MQALIDACLSSSWPTNVFVISNILIALSYYSIPITLMAILIIRGRDISYPAIWILFMVFIAACGTGHAIHAAEILFGRTDIEIVALEHAFTAFVSILTAGVLCYIIPKIARLPSPYEQKIKLKFLVAERTKENNALIREINHRVGNQLQVIRSMLNIESRNTQTPEALDIISRIAKQIDEYCDVHLIESTRDFRGLLEEKLNEDRGHVAQQDRAAAS